MPMALVLVLERALEQRGFDASIQDSNVSWARERARAAALGSKALILVGASRIQLGIDSHVLGDATGMVPVQLAVDGSHFLPVLEGLAVDSAITGVIVVAMDGALLSDVNANDEALALHRYYARTQAERVPWLNSSTTESWLGERLRWHLRSYADGIQPLDSLLLRVLRRDATPQYLVTFPDRTRAADYSRVSMPDFYLQRVARHLNRPLPPISSSDQAAVDAWFDNELDAVTESSSSTLGQRIEYLRELARKVQSRGGSVVFLQMPVSGMIQAIDERREPRPRFWDRFAATVGTPTIHYADVPGMREIQCPDGSHIDRRDRAAFTRILAGELIARGVIGTR